MKLGAEGKGYVVLDDNGAKVGQIEGSPGRYEVRRATGELINTASSVTQGLSLLIKLLSSHKR